MKLLFITQKLHGQDAFILHWLRMFERRGYSVQVLCLENRISSSEFPVYSMGKERGAGKMLQVINFYKYISTCRYDRVFLHMSPVWYALGFWWWFVRGIPCYLWYTHYKMQFGVRLFSLFGKRFFCATPQSLPQYDSSPKKVVTGHGIDLAFWVERENRVEDPHALLVVHRLSRSKRLEIGMRALTFLPASYTMTIYGIEAEPDYVAELRLLVATLGLQSRVTFKGSIPMQQLAEVYPRYRLIVNMASETIDKSMLEAMTCGCYPVTTKRNAQAIGLRSALQSYGRQVGLRLSAVYPEQSRGSRQIGFPLAPEEDTPESVAAFIQNFQGANALNQSLRSGSGQADELYRIVAERHSLEGMIEKMDEYIARGE